MFERTLGAILKNGGVHFRVWAPKINQVEVVIDGDNSPGIPLKKKHGYFTGFVKGLKSASLYRYRLDKKAVFPDPCSLFQPDGPLGPSMVVDQHSFSWTDSDWKGVKEEKPIIYEMHIGTFTDAGTFREAAKKLSQLRWLGVTALEIMPVAEAAGRWGWGYDGVNLFAPNHNYGEFNSFKYFINKAHTLGLAVILDVVYHHFGPSGNSMWAFSPYYFSKKHRSEWGAAINFYEQPSAKHVREFYIQNASYWINDFHLDGLRFDAAQTIFDKSKKHILAEIITRCRGIDRKKTLFFIEENNDQNSIMLKPVSRGGYGIDAAWADDFHRTAHVAITKLSEGYCSDFSGSSQEFISVLRNGYLFQGQHSRWIDWPLGTPVDQLPAKSFIFYLQNHDQVANSITGTRMHEFCPEGLYRVLAAILLLSPETVLLFMGQEFASRSRFIYFADQDRSLRGSILEGRRKLIGQFRSLRKDLQKIPDPASEKTFLMSKLRHEERLKNRNMLNFHHDLIKIRKNDFVISHQDRKTLEGAVITERVFILRYQLTQNDARLLLINTGNRRYIYKRQSLPIIANPTGTQWKIIWRSEALKYGGPEEQIRFGKEWVFPSYSALLFASEPIKD